MAFSGEVRNNRDVKSNAIQGINQVYSYRWSFFIHTLQYYRRIFSRRVCYKKKISHAKFGTNQITVHDCKTVFHFPFSLLHTAHDPPKIKVWEPLSSLSIEGKKSKENNYHCKIQNKIKSRSNSVTIMNPCPKASGRQEGPQSNLGKIDLASGKC